MITYPPPTPQNGTAPKPEETRPNQAALDMLNALVRAFAIRKGHLPQTGAAQ